MKKYILIISVLFLSILKVAASGDSTMMAPFNIDPGYSLNMELEVGATPGMASVTPTGAAAYNIPIFVPPGTEGVQPQISIVYNSQSGNGQLGMGWSIAGLSAITRVGKIYYRDGVTNTVELSYYDRFALDGNRLVCISGNYGYNGAVYGTEVETFSRITSYGASGNGPQWFKVETKDGWTLEYGNTNDSRVEPHGSSTPYMWRLNKATDPHGNYICYTYNEAFGESTVKKIEYTGNDRYPNGGLAPYNKVEFFYKTRTDSSYVFIGGYEVYQDSLLSGIKVTAENQLVKEYKLHYDFNSSHHLVKITEHASDGTQINPTIINWEGGGKPQTTVSNLPFGPLNNTRIYCGDFNGDGRSDLGVATQDEEGSWYQYTYTRQMPNNEGTSFTPGKSHGGLNIRSVINADLNGDGKEDVIQLSRVAKTIDGDLHYQYRYYTFLTSDNGDFCCDGLPHLITVPRYDYSGVQVGDFDGDGSKDMLFYECGAESKTMTWRIISYIPRKIPLPRHSNNEECLYVDTDITKASGTFNNVYGIPYFLDFDGDGKMEMMIVDETDNSGMRIYKFNNNQFQKIHSTGFPTKYHKIGSGDFNGDGKADVMTTVNGSWVINYSTGKELFYKTIQTNIPYSFTDAQGRYVTCDSWHIYDFNGDGKADILFIRKRTSGGNIDYVPVLYVSTHTSGYSAVAHSFGTFTSVPEFQFGDLNGDGKMDIIYWSPSENKWKAVFMHKGENKHLVKSITDGNRHTTTVSYARINEMASYEKGGFRPIPLMSYSGSLYVATSILMPGGGRESVDQIFYQYKDAQVHIQGKGFLGFREIEKSYQNIWENDITPLSRSIEEYSIDTTYYHPALKSIESWKENYYSEKLAVTSYTMGFMSIGGDRYFPYIKQVREDDYRNNLRKESEFTYNTYGTLAKSVTKLFDGVTNQTPQYTDTRTMGYTLIPGTLDWYQLEYDTLEVKHYQQPAEKSITRYVYDVTDTRHKGRISELFSNESDPNLACKTVFRYLDLSGGLRITTNQVNINHNTTNNKYKYYDTKGRWVRRITGQTTTEYTYDPRFGNLLTETGPDGLTTTYTYDNWGKLTRVSYPDGNYVDTEVWWITNVNGAVYYKKTTPSNGRYTYEFYNLLGNVVKTYTRGDGNINLYADITYNRIGQVIRKSLPYNYLGNGPTKWTNYTYNSYGQVSTETTIDNEKGDTIGRISYTYTNNQRKIATFDNISGQSASKKYDTKGRLITSTDNGGTISYVYTSMGNLKEVNALGAKTTFQYDIAGNKTAITEPNTGTTRYEYDHIGLLKKQINANGAVITYIRNNNGRLSEKLYTKGYLSESVNYTYNLAGRIEKIVNASCTTIYMYDTYGRNTQIKERIDNMDFITDFEYDTKGNLKSKSYPNRSGTRFGISYNYFNNGIGGLESISNKSNNSNIWVASGYYVDEWARPVRYSLGNGLQTWVTYDNKDQLTMVKTGTEADPYPGDIIAPWTPPGGYYPPPIIIPMPLSGTIGRSTTFTPELQAYREISRKVLRPYVQSWTYTYNNKGLMTQRTDVYTNQEEHFEYDNLQRLKVVKQKTGNYALTTVANFDYASNGNMEYKSDAGTLKYEAYGKPHLLSGRDSDSDKSKLSHTNSIDDCVTEYTAFHKIRRITEGSYTLEFTYGTDEQRIKTVLKQNGVLVKTKYFIGGGYEYEIYHTEGNRTRELSYFGADYFVGVNVKDSRNGGTNKMYYIHTDHLGSWDKITDETGALVDMQSFDAWGNRRNPNNWQQHDTAAHLFDRGFTGHEHLAQFKIINMNGRLYDPVVGRFFSADPYVQAPDFSQNYNRYSYCLNNPLMYTDPSGEYFWLVAGWLLFTESGYEVQKYISPVAVHIDLHYGSEQKGIGFDVSVGIPKSLPFSYRYHTGRTYYWQHYDDSYTGWEKRSGGEWTLFGTISYSGTTFKSGETSQTTNMITVGNPFANLKYENDYMFGLGDYVPFVPAADGGDRYRTASARVKLGSLTLGVNLFTGDPGLDPNDRNKKVINNREHYVENDYKDNPDKYRAGIFYVGIGPFRIGRNSEKNRNAFQNKFAHSFLMGGKSPYFRVLDLKSEWYWHLGTETGSTLW